MKTLKKTISWRIIASVITIGVTYMITGSVEFAGGVGVIDAILKMVAYYGHEKWWEKK